MCPTCVVWPERPLVSRLAIQTSSVGLGERQRPQEQRVDDAEDGGAGADAEPGDQDGEDGEAGVAAQRAEGVAEVLEQVGEGHGLSLRRGRQRFRLEGIARPPGQGRVDRGPRSCATVTVLLVTPMKMRITIPTGLPLATAPDRA